MCILISKYLADKYNKKIIGITCVEGNTKIKNVITNAIISAKVAGLEVPVFKGICSKNIIGAWRTIIGQSLADKGDDYFHEDGIGGNQ